MISDKDYKELLDKMFGLVRPQKDRPQQIPGVDIPLWDKQYDVEPITK